MKVKEDPKIILIDDDEICNLITKRIINKEWNSLDIISFTSGEEALNFLYASENQFTNFIIFLDINMPIMNGWEFLEKVKENDQRENWRINILTSSVNKDDEILANKYSIINQYYTKPLDISRLRLNLND
jgi:CheY-like chemotaxis protein